MDEDSNRKNESEGSSRRKVYPKNNFLGSISEDGDDIEMNEDVPKPHVMFAESAGENDATSSQTKERRFSRFQSFSQGKRFTSFSQGRRFSSFSRERLQSFSKSARNSLAFDINSGEKREVLAQRRMSHLSKFSKLKEDQTDLVLRRVSVMRDDVPVPTARGRRDSAAVVLFKAGVSKISAKPTSHVSSWDTYGGRSFLSSDLDSAGNDDVDGDVDDLYAYDLSFFDFNNMDDIKDEHMDLFTLDEESEETVGDAGNVTIDTIDTIDTVVKGVLKKRGKAQLQEKTREKKKAWFLFGSLLNRRIKQKVSEKLKYQFDDQREYFTVWLSFVQIVIMVTVLCIYPFAPVGTNIRKINREVLLSREGVLYHENLQRKMVECVWLGPTLETLILLGAKYAPCMRRDKRVFAAIDEERKRENNTGCCMQALANGCIQREPKYCITPSVLFKSKSVCGQDPKFCLQASKPPETWDPHTIISWAKCDKVPKVNPTKANRHMTCEVTGRPCCVNTQGQCLITTQDNCKFWNGIYHPDATLCSQVDCLSATCGNSFSTNDHPDQIYRLFLSLFLCAGLLHLVIVLLFNFTILRDIEGYAGWFRTALIFLLSGAGGNLWSSVWLPYQVQVGESGAMFGIFACVFVEGLQNWKLLENPCYYMGKLFTLLFIMLCFGLLPYIDNFAHIFGFIYGILLGFIILPNVATSEDEDELQRDVEVYIVLRVIAVIVVLALTVTGFVMFYHLQYTQTTAIAMFNCPFGGEFCQNFHRGQQLEEREIEY